MQHPNKKLSNYKRLYRLYDDGAVFTAIDTETSSLSPSDGTIIEIGALKFNKDGIISEFQFLFNPQSQLPQIVSELTNITQKVLDSAPFIQEKIPFIYSFIKDSILIAHNAQFDLNFINAEFEKAKYPVSKNKFIDTLGFSQFIYPSLETHKLEGLADYFKINKGSSHRAFDDAVTCYKLFELLINESRIRDKSNSLAPSQDQ